MNADPIKNIAASLKNRLLSTARQSGKPFQSLLTHYGLERFLFRLSRSPGRSSFPKNLPQVPTNEPNGRHFSGKLRFRAYRKISR